MQLLPLLAGLSIATTAFAQDPIPKLAVMRLEPLRVSPDIGRILDELLIKAIDDRGLYDVVSTDEINAVLGLERQKELLGCEDVTCVAEIGGALGVEWLLLGTVSRLGNEIIVSLKLADTKGMDIQRSESRTIDQETQYEAAVQKALDKILGSGSLTVVSDPAGATVVLDGKGRGSSPLTLGTIPAGRHQLRLELDDHESHEVAVLVRKGSNQQIDAPMSLLSGTITINTTPSGATCYVDGKAIGESPCTKSGVPIGQHEVEVRRDYFEAETATVTVKHGQETPWKAVLAALPVPVTVGSEPQGAEVQLNGRSVGVTVHKTELTPGDYELELDLAGYESVAQPLSIVPGEPEALSIALVPGLSNSEKRAQRFKQITKWSLTGIFAAATAVWIWQGLQARSLEQDAEKLHVSSPEFAEVRSDARTASTVADVSLATAVLAAGGATYFWITMEF